MRDYEEIRNFTDPLSLKKLNDQLRLLWYKTKNITGKDIRYDTLSADKLIVSTGLVVGGANGIPIDTSVEDIINSKVDADGVVTIAKGVITADYIKTLGLQVGNQISMGPNATISWQQVTDKPEPGITEGQLYTILGQDYIVTGKITANQIEGGELKIGGVGGSYGMIRIYDSSGVERGIISASSVSFSYAFINTGSFEYASFEQGFTCYSWAYVEDNLSCGSLSTSTVYANKMQSESRSVNIQQDSSVMVVYNSGNALFAVKSDGSKIGGVVTKDDKKYFMSPVDSPRMLIQDIITDVELSPDGVTVLINPELAEIIDGYAIVCNSNAKIVEKQPDRFIVKGEGKTDFLIIGKRYDHKDDYWFPIETIEPDGGVQS